MKKIFRNNRIIVLAFFTVFSTSLNSAPVPDFNPLPIEFKFIGMMKNDPVFQLSFHSLNEDEYTITVTDESGFCLYQENISGKTFSKKFLLNTEEIGNEKLRFEIISRKTGEKIWYDVNPVNRFEQEWLVNRGSKNR